MRFAAVTVLLALTGCASQSLSIRTQPQQTPAADAAAAAANAEAFAEAAGNAPLGDRAPPPDVAPVTAADAPPMYTYDPWERLNRFTYRFNARFDEALFLPVANTYRRLPSPMRTGVHNFFFNLSEIDSMANYTLQGRLKFTWRSVERFVINSTIGIIGVFDVATRLKMPGAATGFGTTLSAWGMHPGPFLVIPLLGPSTLRGTIGYLGDYGLNWGINIFDIYRGNASYPLGTLNAIDTRANVNFRYYATGSAFEYETIRFLYVRKQLLEDEGLHKKQQVARPPPDAPAGK